MNFPEMWLNRVIMIITTLTMAPWLNGIPELDTKVIEAGSGSASENNIIHVPLESFEVDVLINNTTYPIGSQTFTDDEAIIKLDKYQTKVTTLSDDQVMGASYERIDSATRAHTRAILSNKFKKAIHALSPAKETNNTPVIATTGAVVDGRAKLQYKDLLSLKRKLDNNQVPLEGRRLVLSSNHVNDLLEDRDRFANLLSNMNNGKLAPKIAGFEIYSYAINPNYFKNGQDNDLFTKVPFGAIGGVEASVCFSVDNVAKKTGLTKQYFKPAANDPDNQTNRLNYRHYFIAMPFQMKYMGAIVSAETHKPVVDAIDPTTGSTSGGETITITGEDFLGSSAVSFSTTDAASFSVLDNNTIEAVVPSGLSASTHPVKVTNADGDSNVDVKITVS